MRMRRRRDAGSSASTVSGTIPASARTTSGWASSTGATSTIRASPLRCTNDRSGPDDVHGDCARRRGASGRPTHRDTILSTDDDGVTFRSVYDGAPARFTPELVADIQSKLGSDIAMCLDICAPVDVSGRTLEEAVRRTTLWAKRQRAAPRADGQLVFGIAQGASDPELRRRSIVEVAELDF